MLQHGFMIAPVDDIQSQNLRQHRDTLVEIAAFAVTVHKTGGMKDWFYAGLPF